jgi:glycosyltransferase involved in cell wall biosynthesis
MTIAIDCRMIASSGIGVYLRGILPFLIKSNYDFLLLGNARQLGAYGQYSNVTLISCDVKPFSLKELFFFPVKLKRQLNKADIFFSPFFNFPPLSIPVFTTIHDIIFPDMPELTSKPGLAIRMFFLRRAYRKSKKIFTVSEFSKSRIEYHLGTAKPVIVTYSAIKPEFLEYRNKLSNIKKNKTIIFIGNIKKHKGLDYLLDAFRLARNEGLPYKLVIIGEKEKFRTADTLIFKKIDSIVHGSEPDAVFFTGFISDEKLMKRLAEASLLVQPSLYEGFGLPPLEAMVLGTHALISDIPVFKEIYNEFPVTFFNAGDPENLKNKLLDMLKNTALPVLQNELLSEGLLSKYTFEKTAQKILREIE